MAVAPAGYLTPDQMQAALAELEALRSLLGMQQAPLSPEVSAAGMARAPTSNIGLANDSMGAGRDTGAFVRPYEPGLRDRMGAMIAGTEGNETRGAAADIIAGTRGIGPQGPTIAGVRPSDMLGAGPAADFLEQSSRGELGPAMASGVGAVAGGAPRLGGRAVSEAMEGMGYLARPAADAIGAGLDAGGRALAAAPRTATAGLTAGYLGTGTTEAGEPAKGPGPSPTAVRTLFPDDPELSALRARREGMVSTGNATYTDDPELTRLRTTIQQLGSRIASPADKKITTATRNAWIADKTAAEAAYQTRLATLEGNQRGDVGGIDKEIATRFGDLKRQHPTFTERYPTLAENITAAQFGVPIAAGLLVRGGQAAATRNMTAPWRAAIREGETALAGDNLPAARIAHAGADKFKEAGIPGYLSSATAPAVAGVSAGEAIAMAPQVHNRANAPPGSAERESAEAFLRDPNQWGPQAAYGAASGFLGGWTGAKLGTAANQYIPGAVPPAARTDALGARITAAERESTRAATPAPLEAVPVPPTTAALPPPPATVPSRPAAELPHYENYRRADGRFGSPSDPASVRRRRRDDD